MMSVVPIALFAYSRPEHLKQVLEGIRINKVPLVYAFVDGPATDLKTPAVNQVIELLKAVTWTDLRIVIREKNYGLADSIRSGISEVLAAHDRLIVLEDDIVMRSGAYKQTVAALSQFENDDRVMSVSMWTDPRITPKTDHNGFFSGRFICWGWATYRKYWELYNDSPLKVYNKCIAAGIPVHEWGDDLKWQAEHAEQKKLWYVGYALTHLLYGKLSYFPKSTFTVNIGRDGSGENTGGGKQDDIALLAQPVEQDANWPKEYDPSLRKKIARYFDPQKQKTLKELVYAVYKKYGFGA